MKAKVIKYGEMIADIEEMRNKLKEPFLGSRDWDDRELRYWITECATDQEIFDEFMSHYPELIEKYLDHPKEAQ